jgi:hypothetical protein
MKLFLGSFDAIARPDHDELLRELMARAVQHHECAALLLPLLELLICGIAGLNSGGMPRLVQYRWRPLPRRINGERALWLYPRQRRRRSTSGNGRDSAALRQWYRSSNNCGFNTFFARTVHTAAGVPWIGRESILYTAKKCRRSPEDVPER